MNFHKISYGQNLLCAQIWTCFLSSDKSTTTDLKLNPKVAPAGLADKPRRNKLLTEGHSCCEGFTEAFIFKKKSCGIGKGRGVPEAGSCLLQRNIGSQGGTLRRVLADLLRLAKFSPPTSSTMPSLTRYKESNILVPYLLCCSFLFSPATL